MIGRTRWHFPEVDSTQNIAFALAEAGANHGTIVRADYQSAGRGRQGKTWQAPTGSSLMFSVLLRPEVPFHELGTLSILVARALADEVASRTTDPVHIKWPNDVLINGKKLSGILLQTRSNPSPVAVLGIGINLNMPPELLPETATSLSRHVPAAIDPGMLLDSLAVRLNSTWDSVGNTLSASILQKLDKRLWLNQEIVSLLDGDRVITGRILGIAQNGGLRLNVQGRERVVVAGEITRGPRPVSGRNAE